MTLRRAAAVHSSTDGTIQPVMATERIHAIGMLRGIALFGVLAVNLVDEFRVSLLRVDRFTRFHSPASQHSSAIQAKLGHCHAGSRRRVHS